MQLGLHDDEIVITNRVNQAAFFGDATRPVAGEVHPTYRVYRRPPWIALGLGGQALFALVEEIFQHGPGSGRQRFGGKEAFA
jgi:hypothetical protein